MYLLDLFQAKALFLLMVLSLIIIPVWMLLVAFTKKKGKADSVDAPDVEPEHEPEAAEERG